ncbi:MAG: VacJ family lipoprotein [Pseudomonadota bacterium]
MTATLRVLLVLLALTGCASGPNANPNDPLEPFNRGVYQFNDAVDKAVLKPVATTYKNVVPNPVRQGVSNFFDNLQDAWSFVNNALQLKGEAAMDSFFRFGINTFVGLGGILDVATEMRIEKHTKDFGHTLGYWGVGPGPYIVLPLFGPSTLRDTAALPVDFQGDLVYGVEDIPTRNALTVLRVVDKRTQLLQAGTLLEEAALDKYTFTREAFLQRRRNQVFDGNPPDDASSWDSWDTESKEAQEAAQPPVEKPAQTPAETLSNTKSPEIERTKP